MTAADRLQGEPSQQFVDLGVGFMVRLEALGERVFSA